VTLTHKDGTDTLSIIVTKSKCPAPTTACDAGDIQDLDISSCECKALPATQGDLFELATNDKRKLNLALNDKFTIREFLVNDKFEWSVPQAEDLTCLKQVEISDDSRYRQISYEATTPDCEYTIIRNKITSDGTIDSA
jgi:hypothetical protein